MIEHELKLTYFDHSDFIQFRENGRSLSRVHDNGCVVFNYRIAGPSCIREYGAIWFTARGGMIHRVDGPAVINADGRKEYWVLGERLDSFEFFTLFGTQ